VPAGQLDRLRPTPGALTLLAGGPAQKLDVAVERGGDGPVQVELQAPAGVTVRPPTVTLDPGQPAAAFELTAGPDVGAGSDTLMVTARQGAETLRRELPLTLKRRDAKIPVEVTAEEVALRPGQTHALPVTVNRDDGFRGTVTLALQPSPAVEPAQVTVPATESRAELPLALKPDAPDGPVTLRVKATAPNLPPQDLTVAVRVVGLRELRAFDGPGSRVECVAVSPTGRVVLTGHADGTLQLWDPATGPSKRLQPKHDGPVRCAVFSPDGRQALSGGADKSAQLWEVATGRQVRRFHNRTHAGEVWQVRFDPDLTPVSVSADKTVFWDVSTGLEKRTGGVRDLIAGVVRQKPMIADGASPTPETKVPAGGPFSLAGLGGDALVVYRDDAQAARLAGHGKIAAMTLSADGKRALALGEDGRLRLWDVPNEKLLPGSPWSPSAAVTAVALTPDGGQALLGTADGSLRLWKLPQ
jgi:hypothetical protein